MSDCKFQDQGCRWCSKFETYLLTHLKRSEIQPKSNRNRLNFQNIYNILNGINKCLDLKSGHKIRQFLEVHLRYVSTYRLNFPGDAKTLGLVIESCGCGEGGYKRLYDRHF